MDDQPIALQAPRAAMAQRAPADIQPASASSGAGGVPVAALLVAAVAAAVIVFVALKE